MTSQQRLLLYTLVATTTLGSQTVLSNDQLGERFTRTNSATVEVKGIVLTIKTEKERYYIDEPIVLSVLVSNAGPTEIGITATPFLINLDNISVTLSGEKTPETLYCRRLKNGVGSRSAIAAPPGWQEKRPFHLNRLFDMTITGEYQVSLRKTFSLLYDGKRQEIDVRSGVITISVDDVTFQENDGRKR